MRFCTPLLLLLLLACQSSPTTAPTPTSTPTSHGHHHEAPHGGTLVVLGEEFAHLELVLKPKDGQLTVYVLDGEAANAVRPDDSALELSLESEGGPEVVTLKPVANELTGETASSSSEFQGTSEQLVGKERFLAKLTKITLKGQSFEGVELKFPEGNEDQTHSEEHHEHDDHDDHDDHDHDDHSEEHHH